MVILCVCDVDFERGQLILRDIKSRQDRVMVLPESLVPALQKQVEYVRVRHVRDRQRRHGLAPVPSMARSEKKQHCQLNRSATQHRKNSPRSSCGRLAIDCSFRRVSSFSSVFVLA